MWGLGLHATGAEVSNIKLRGRLVSMTFGGSTGLHFALEVIGSELIIPGRETGGTDNGLPVVCSETVNAGGFRGSIEKLTGVSGAVGVSEMTCQSESEIVDESSEIFGTEFPICAAT